MSDRVEIPSEESKRKFSLTSWLKLKLLGKEEVSPVDTRFLADLSDIKTVGRYEIMGKIGQGSTGVVYLGRDPYINRSVGIKISRPSADVMGEKADRYRKQFFIEAQSAGRLLHPGIVAIYDAGMYKDFCYITMEYVDGQSLKKYCFKENLLPVRKTVEVIIKACYALDYAHRQGVIHRDIKPSNILLDRCGEVKITDFGIARLKNEQTSFRGIVGSPSYMSPEQVREQPVEEKSDVFSLGAVFYELLTGCRAFAGENCFSIMYKIANADPVSVRTTRPDIPEILWKICQKALAKDASRRYQTCMDLAYDLRVALRGLKGASSADKVETVIDYVHEVSFFEDFTKDQVREILHASRIIKVGKGKMVVAEGDIDDAFYIILSGKVWVCKGKRTIASLIRGECFGEMSILSGQTRVATVVAETDCILMKISGILLDRSSESVQLLFMRKFALTLLHRLAKKIQEDA